MRNLSSRVLFSFTPGFSPVVNAPKSQGTVSTVSLRGIMSSTHFPKGRRSEKPLKRFCGFSTYRVTGLKPGLNEKWTNWSRNELGASSHD